MLKSVLALATVVSSLGSAQTLVPAVRNLDRIRIHHASQVEGENGRVITQNLSAFTPPRSPKSCVTQLLNQIDQELKNPKGDYSLRDSIKSLDIWVGSPDSVREMVNASVLTCRKMPRNDLWYIASRKEPKIAKEGFGGWIDEVMEIGLGSPFSDKSRCESELSARRNKNYLKSASGSTVVYVEARRADGKKVLWRAVHREVSPDKNFLSLNEDCEVSNFNMLELISRGNGLMKESADRARTAEEREAAGERQSHRGVIHRSKSPAQVPGQPPKAPKSETKRLPLTPGSEEVTAPPEGYPED